LANNLKAAQKVLSDEKSARLRVENSLAEKKSARQAAEQSFQQSNDANATLTLETARTSLAATRGKLDSKSKALDFQVIHVDEVVLRLKNNESQCQTPFRERGNEASIRVPRMFKSHAWQQYDKPMQC
jgi:hypothetical protein